MAAQFKHARAAVITGKHDLLHAARLAGANCDAFLVLPVVLCSVDLSHAVAPMSLRLFERWLL